MVLENDDEPLTPAGRLFVQPLMDQIIHGVFMLENPIDVGAIKKVIEDSVMLQHPRFSSLMVAADGGECWRRTQVHFDDHVVVRSEPVSDDEGKTDADKVNDYVADLTVSTPLSRDKPLWEVHLLTAHNALLFRVHHALGDGISLMSMFLSGCRLRADPTRPPSVGGGVSSTDGKKTANDWKRLLWRWIKVVWFTLIYLIDFVTRAFWVRDRSTVVSGGAGVELWPRRLATARFRLEDMKAVKSAIPGATINDVLFGIISCGLSRYLDIRSSETLADGLRITGLSMVSLRPQGGLQDMSKLMKSDETKSRWGNKFGMILLPVYYHRRGKSDDPLQFVRRAKEMIDKKKLSLEAFFSYKIGYIIMSLLGAKAASILNYRIICNTTFTVSNVMGPQEEIMVGDNPVKNITVTVSSLPHAITMHMMSYAGFAELQVLVAKDIIPEPKVLANCFEGALLEMIISADRKK